MKKSKKMNIKSIHNLENAPLNYKKIKIIRKDLGTALYAKYGESTFHETDGYHLVGSHKPISKILNLQNKSK
jgi:hypothetical protein